MKIKLFCKKIIIFYLAYFEKDAANPTRDRIEEATAYLASDKDTDVRSIFHPQMTSNEKFYDSDGEPIGDVSVSINFS